MKKKTEFLIDLKLDHIKIRQIKFDKFGDYHIYVSCSANSAICHKCKRKISKSHGQCNETMIQHLPILERRVFIYAKWPRFVCDNCDEHPTTSFHPEWLGKSGECTKDYETYILKCLINSTVKDIAMKNRTTEERILGIVNRCVSLNIQWSNLNLKQIGIDEIALRKGHSHYLTIVSDISTPGRVRIIAVLDGRAQEEILPFFESIPKQIWENLDSISIDMGSSYVSTLKKILDPELFDRLVTIDRFHVAKLINGKVDKERKHLCQELKGKYKDNKEYLKIFKDTMWPFRHHPKDLDTDEKNRLECLFIESPELKKCHYIREELYEIFESYISKEEAKIVLQAWCLMALDFKTKDNPFETFVKTYYQHEQNILNYFMYRHSSGAVEGLNNKIKVVKRRCFGFENVINFSKRLFLDINMKDLLFPFATV